MKKSTLTLLPLTVALLSFQPVAHAEWELGLTANAFSSTYGARPGLSYSF